MIRLFIFFCCATLLFSCEKEELPGEILTPEQMVASLTELYVMEAKVSNIPVNRDSILQIADYLETRTFDKLGIPDSVFKKSYSYYLDRPKEMENIYTVLIDSLNLREQRSGTPIKKE
jgi:hypothetical protein